MTAALAQFLRARLDREEAYARIALRSNENLVELLRSTGEEVAGLYGDPEPPEDEVRPADRMWWLAKDAADWIEHQGPAQALTDIEADRALLTEYEAVVEMDREDAEPEFAYGRAVGLGIAVRYRAQKYDDHPDYREEWRP